MAILEDKRKQTAATVMDSPLGIDAPIERRRFGASGSGSGSLGVMDPFEATGSAVSRSTLGPARVEDRTIAIPGGDFGPAQIQMATSRDATPGAAGIDPQAPVEAGGVPTMRVINPMDSGGIDPYAQANKAVSQGMAAFEELPQYDPNASLGEMFQTAIRRKDANMRNRLRAGLFQTAFGDIKSQREEASRLRIGAARTAAEAAESRATAQREYLRQRDSIFETMFEAYKTELPLEEAKIKAAESANKYMEAYQPAPPPSMTQAELAEAEARGEVQIMPDGRRIIIRNGQEFVAEE